MALSVDYLYKFSLRLIKKNQAGGLTSLEFNDFWSAEQCAYQDDLAGRFQARSNGKSGANTGLIENETILQKLAPFIQPVTLSISSGLAEKPINFLYRLGMRIDGYDAHKINFNQVATVNHSVIDPPSVAEDMYYFTEYLNYYSFLPNTVTAATLDCMNTPAALVWGYTFDGDGRQVYNSGASVQPLWDNNSCREITERMLTKIGVAFKDNDFSNFGRAVTATGNP